MHEFSLHLCIFGWSRSEARNADLTELVPELFSRGKLTFFSLLSSRCHWVLYESLQSVQQRTPHFKLKYSLNIWGILHKKGNVFPAAWFGWCSMLNQLFRNCELILLWSSFFRSAVHKPVKRSKKSRLHFSEVFSNGYRSQSHTSTKIIKSSWVSADNSLSDTAILR